MRTFLASFLVALVTGALLVPVIRRVAMRLGAVSIPGGRHVHKESIPRLGGVAIFFAFFAPIALLFLVETGVAETLRSEWQKAVGLLLGGSLMCAVGALDDTKGLRALHKLGAQVVAACVAFAFGFRIVAVSLPIVGDLQMGVFALPITVLWIVGIINAINLIDGLDGLAAGVAIFAAITNFVVAYLAGSVLVGLLMSAMLGAALGFLIYNFNPARIFMGDSGSYFIGYVLAVTSLAGALQKASTTVSLLVPVVALGVPIFDTLFAMVRRFLERRPIFSPDRGHIHHRLLDMGLTHRRAVLIIYGVSVVFTVSAIAISLGRSWEVGIALVCSSAVLLGLVRFVGYFEYLHLSRRQKARFRSRHAELLRRLIPDVPALFARAETEDEVFAVLNEIAERGKLGYIDVLALDDERRLSRASFDLESSPRTQVAARFPLGEDHAARASIEFAWNSDFEDVSPQTEILLQVIADVMSQRLTAVRSAYAPRVPKASDSQQLRAVEASA